MSPSALAEHIENVPLVDHHVHGCWLESPNRRRFENGLSEANIEPLADFDSAFGTQLGFAVRAQCTPLLGLPRHADADAYWNRRSEHTEDALARLFLSEAKVSDCLMDTGFASRVADLDALASLSIGRVHEIVRLESVVEEAIKEAGDYATAFARLLDERAKTAIATKSILAYRGGFDGDLSEPTLSEVAEAAQRWRDSGDPRLTDRALLRFALYQGLRLGKPLQFHVGFGDRDCDLHSTNPLYLLDFLRNSGGTPIMLLHCYPYEREAGYLAQAFTTSTSTGPGHQLPRHTVDGVHRPATGDGAVPQGPVLVGRIRSSRTALARGAAVAQRDSRRAPRIRRRRRMERTRRDPGRGPDRARQRASRLPAGLTTAHRGSTDPAWRRCRPRGAGSPLR
jgi:predicted TIM-barrel fold metal-dependent hydrolase